MIKNSLHQHVLFTEYQAVQQICNPLKKLNILGFIYMRRHNDGSFVDLSTNLPWSDYFLNRYFKNQYKLEALNDHMFIMNGISLWTLNQGNVIWEEGETLFGFGNGITLTFKKESYTDIFCFYTKKEYAHMNAFYLKNIDLLTRFTDYFLEKASSIIKKGCENPLCVPESYLTSLASTSSQHQKNRLDEFLQQINYPNITMQIVQRLTKRELQYLPHIAKGKSAKQIAKALQLSTRTVETYMANIKTKLGVYSKYELIEFLNKNKSYYPAYQSITGIIG